MKEKATEGKSILGMIGKIKMPTQDEMRARLKEKYEDNRMTVENMSFWFPKVQDSLTRAQSVLRMPATKTATLSFEWFEWLSSDAYTDEKRAEFHDYMTGLLGDFEQGRPIFMKTGVFSDKFNFFNCAVYDRSKVGDNYLNIFYTAMLFGANASSEVVFREFVEDEEQVPSIYNGMPLHTEFRVFYDFDKREVVGVANYWHPDEMRGRLHGSDPLFYEQGVVKIEEEYAQMKGWVCQEVNDLMAGVSGIEGRWSVDVMKNGRDFWLIDMARMERSALVNRMEPLDIEEGK